MPEYTEWLHIPSELATDKTPSVTRCQYGETRQVYGGGEARVLIPLATREAYLDDFAALGYERIEDAMYELRGQSKLLPHVIDSGTPIGPVRYVRIT